MQNQAIISFRRQRHDWIELTPQEETQVKRWQCMVCGYIYNEEQGMPEDGVPPGTAWNDVPEDWACPDCGVGKEDFEMVEI